MIKFVWLMSICFLLTFISGCADESPVPDTPPYTVPNKEQKTLTEAELVNSIVSGIALKMAVDQHGPYRIQSAGKLTTIGRQVIVELEKMKLSRYDGRTVLVLRERSNLLSIVGKNGEFYSRTW